MNGDGKWNDDRALGWPNEPGANWTAATQYGAPIILHLSRYPSYGG